jgi:hypothetical protein
MDRPALGHRPNPPHRRAAGPLGRWSPALLALLALGAAWAPSAALADDPVMANDLGTGGAHRANPRSLATLLDAPAMLGVVDRYDLGLSFALGPDKERALQIAALDSRTSRVSAGVSWTRVAAESGLQTEDLPGWLVEGETVEEKEVRNRVGLGVALPLANRRLGLGLSGWYDHRGTPDGDPNQGGNIAVSAAANLADEHLLMSVQGVNLLPWRMYYNPIQVTAGLRLQQPKLASIEANLVAPMGDTEEELGFQVGGELIASEVVPLRLGFERATADGSSRATTGIGVLGDRGAIDYGARFLLGEARASEGWSSWHGLSLRLFF